MRRRFDAIVIGLGAMGASACAHLAREGLRVLGIEQFTRAHDRGSSHGGSRVVRWTYFEHASYVPLLTRARALWSELEELSHEQLIHRCGVLYAGDPAGEVLRGVRSSAREHDIELTELERDELRRRFPQFAIPEGAAAVFEPGAGFVRPEAAVCAQLRLAEGHGATLLEGERVERIEERAGSVMVESVAEQYEAAAVVVTAGAWTGRLLLACGAVLQPTRQVIAWIDPGAHAAAADESKCPVWFIEDGPRGAFYGVPVSARREGTAEAAFPAGVKVARHMPGRCVDPDAPRHAPTAEELTDLADAMRRLVPGASGEISGAANCMYTMTPDAHFIVDSAPGSNRVFIAAGFSGHGFKFAPVIGEILTGLVTRGGTGHDIDFLRARRFDPKT